MGYTRQPMALLRQGRRDPRAAFQGRDKIITLFTGEEERSGHRQGVRRNRSPLVAATQLLPTAELSIIPAKFCQHQSGQSYTVFYPLRNDPMKMSLSFHVLIGLLDFYDFTTRGMGYRTRQDLIRLHV